MGRERQRQGNKGGKGRELGKKKRLMDETEPDFPKKQSKADENSKKGKISKDYLTHLCLNTYQQALITRQVIH